MVSEYGSYNLLLVTQDGAREIADALDNLSEFVDTSGVSSLLSVYSVDNTANGDSVRVRIIPNLDAWSDTPYWLYLWIPDTPWVTNDIGDTKLLDATPVFLDAADLRVIANTLMSATPNDSSGSISINNYDESYSDEVPDFDVPIIWFTNEKGNAVPVLSMVTTEQSGRIFVD